MLSFIIIVIALAAAAIGFKLRVPGSVNPGSLGYMSTSWLVQYRASRGGQ
jgi:hypothetical protein